MNERTYSFDEVTSLVRTNLLGWGVVATLFCIIRAALLYSAVPRFVDLFRGFGADLSAVTQFTIKHSYLLWAIPALSVLLLVLALVAPAERFVTRHRRFVVTFAALCGASLVVSGLAVGALYEPIFALGAVV
jgi:type II secretory pathway component PulF